jgi:hypothetical protein
MAYPIVLIALGPLEYFQRREPFSLLRTMVNNPIMSMGVIFMAIVLAFPSVLSIDPDALEEAQAGLAELTESTDGKIKAS